MARFEWPSQLPQLGRVWPGRKVGLGRLDADETGRVEGHLAPSTTSARRRCRIAREVGSRRSHDSAIRGRRECGGELRSRGGPGGTVKQEIPSERCGEAARSVGRCRRGAPTLEGRSRKGRMGKDGGRGRESSEGEAAFIPSTLVARAQGGLTLWPGRG
jgi:hypothetical protein